MSATEANRAYEERFIAEHGVSRGAYRWRYGNRAVRDEHLSELSEAGTHEVVLRTPFGPVTLTATEEAARKAAWRYRAQASVRRAKRRLAEIEAESRADW